MKLDIVGAPPSVQGNTSAPVRVNGGNLWQASQWPRERTSGTGLVNPETGKPAPGRNYYTFNDGDRVTVELSERLQAEGRTPSDTEWLRMCKAAEEARGLHCNYNISPERPKRQKVNP